MKCDCGHEPTFWIDYGEPGYDVIDGKTLCYACGNRNDTINGMRREGEAILHLYKKKGKNGKFHLGNYWSTVVFKDFSVVEIFGRDNIRRDVVFKFEGQKWYGVQVIKNESSPYSNPINCRRKR